MKLSDVWKVLPPNHTVCLYLKGRKTGLMRRVRETELVDDGCPIEYKDCSVTSMYSVCRQCMEIVILQRKE